MIIDLHVHTVRGSSDSALRLTELVAQSVAVGLNAVCVTEHDHVWRDPHFTDHARDTGLIVVHGMEVSTEYGHVLAYGLPAYLSGIHRFATLRQEADRHGAVLFAAHPFRRAFEKGPMRHNKLGLWFPTVEEAAAHPLFRMVDGIEVENGGTADHENAFAAEVARRLGLPMIGGSDSHSANSLGHRATILHDSIRSERDLVEALRAGRCGPTANPVGGGATILSG